MKKPYGSYSSVRSNDCFGGQLLSDLCGLVPAVIRANVVSGVRPPFSSDDCSDDFKSLIVRCWDPLRLTFPGTEFKYSKQQTHLFWMPTAQLSKQSVD